MANCTFTQRAQHPGQLVHGTGVVAQEFGDPQLVRIVIEDDVDIFVIDGVTNDLIKLGLANEPLTETGSVYRLILRVIKPPAQRLLRIRIDETDFFALVG